MPIHY